MLGTEHGTKPDTVGGRQLVHDVRETVSDRGVIAHHADHRAAKARRRHQRFRSEPHTRN